MYRQYAILTAEIVFHRSQLKIAWFLDLGSESQSGESSAIDKQNFDHCFLPSFDQTLFGTWLRKNGKTKLHATETFYRQNLGAASILIVPPQASRSAKYGTMAPSIAAPRKSILKASSRPRKVEAESPFANTKKDKRRIKHAQLLSKVEKSAKPKSRKRRPSKKLIATLDSLADALPNNIDGRVGADDMSGGRSGDQVNIIRRKSMKSRPGAMKRREKLDKTERDRFAKNLAQMAGGASATGASEHANAPKPEDRLKALRSFIAQTMEKRV